METDNRVHSAVGKSVQKMEGGLSCRITRIQWLTV